MTAAEIERVKALLPTTLGSEEIRAEVDGWLAALPVTREEIARACRYAATDFDDAAAGST